MGLLQTICTVHGLSKDVCAVKSISLYHYLQLSIPKSGLIVVAFHTFRICLMTMSYEMCIEDIPKPTMHSSN